MLPSRRVLAVLLCLSAVSSSAQVERVAAPSLLPLSVVPAAAGAAPLLAAPALSGPTAPSLSVPAFAAAPILALPAVAPSLAVVPAAASAEIEAAPAAAAAALAAAPLAAAADGPSFRLPGGAGPGGDPRLGPGRKLFDGSGDYVTRSGSVFARSPAAPPVLGGVAFVRVKAAPAAPVKAVPATQGLYGEPLLERVSDIAARGQTKHEYRDASQYLFSHADNHTLNGVRGVADAYSGLFIPGTSADGQDYTETGDKTHDGWSRAQRMNVEHVFPQSLFKQDLPMRSDLHHLMATFEHPNGMRGSYPFGVVDGAPDYRNDAGAKRGDRRFEPPDFTKGRVARAMLYFYARYKNEPFFRTERVAAFWNDQVETMLDWNRRFPPTVEERTRNDQVEAFQGNRNPFVDDPGLAERIGRDALLSPLSRTAAPGRRALFSTADPRRATDQKRSDKPREGKKRGKFHRPQHGRGSNRGGYRGY